MARAGFRRDLQDLHDQTLVLGNMVDHAILKAIDCLVDQDLPLAEAVVAGDASINQKRYQIEEQAVQLIALQQPNASDLRTIVAVLNIIVDLERMGDHAAGIARISLLYGFRPHLKPLGDVITMAERSREMLGQALDALITRNVDAAKIVAAEDDTVDAIYDRVYRELLDTMIADPSTIDRATWLLWAAHNLERIADRVTNICERVVFEATGRMHEVNVSTY